MVFTISSFDVASNSGLPRPSRNEYKLNFTINTKVKQSKIVLVPTNVYSFTPAPDVFNESYNNNYLVDVIGVMTGVGVERDGVKTKMNVIELDSNGFLSANINSPASGLIQLPNSSRIPVVIPQFWTV
ncbi:DUF223 domain protein [Medicago truncatula]|uniref:DUF223 domain protein n=1 Tax=Medicago truncatula TaxID=3880 RepID=A0A072UYJ2_MEDTR|nr:DUF223 domain protein [Medicago truncatula]